MKTKIEESPAPPAKLREDIRTVASWQDVDVALGVLRLCDARKAGIAAELDVQIQALQQKKAELLKPLDVKVDRVEKLVEAFVTEHRAQIDNGKSKTQKSRKLVHGSVGFKKDAPQVLFVTSEKATLKLIGVRGLTDCVRITEAVDKGKVKDLSKSEQAAIGVRVAQKEDFFYKLNVDQPVEYPKPGETAGEGAEAAS